MKTIDDLIVRRFTKELEGDKDRTVYDLFQWKRVDVIIKDYRTNEIIHDMRNLEFPAHYSQNACDIIASHYFRKAGLKDPVGHETRAPGCPSYGSFCRFPEDEGMIRRRTKVNSI